MFENSNFRFKIASVHGLEGEILEDAIQLSAMTGDNVGILRKTPTAGPNDILYLLADVDFWSQFVPWAAAAIAGGALSAVGKRLLDRVYPSKDARTLLGIDQRQKMIGDKLENLLHRIESIDRYVQKDSEIRIGFSYFNGLRRWDPGVVLHGESDELPLAILALAISGERIAEIFNEFSQRNIDLNGVDRFDVKIEDDGVHLAYGFYGPGGFERRDELLD